MKLKAKDKAVECVKECLAYHCTRGTELKLGIYMDVDKIQGVIAKIKDDTFCIKSNEDRFEFSYDDVSEVAMLAVDAF